MSADERPRSPLRVLVTGANGFVGRRLLTHLQRHTDWRLRAAARALPGDGTGAVEHIAYGDLASHGDWRAAVAGVDAVIHLAARVHVMRDVAGDASDLYRRVNALATERLARAAAEAGVRRFVLVSSVKVNGESTPRDAPFAPGDAPRPQDAYGISKLEAEQAVQTIAAASSMEAVIVRPCLVYGPGVGANFEALMRWLCKATPLPFGAIDNLRSLVAIDNLCSLLAACASHPAAKGRVFLASDGEDVSTTALIRRLGAALDVPARLVAVPEGLIRAGLALAGRADVGRRLCDSLRVDSSAARFRLGWHPVVTLDQGLRLTADAFLASRQEKQQ